MAMWQLSESRQMLIEPLSDLDRARRSHRRRWVRFAELSGSPPAVGWVVLASFSHFEGLRMGQIGIGADWGKLGRARGGFVFRILKRAAGCKRVQSRARVRGGNL